MVSLGFIISKTISRSFKDFHIVKGFRFQTGLYKYTFQMYYNGFEFTVEDPFSHFQMLLKYTAVFF